MGRLVFVENAGNTSGLPLPSGCKSWIDYWNKERKRRNLPPAWRRSNFKKHEKDLLAGFVDGAHVKIVGDASGQLYIVPLCPACNAPGNTAPFLVDVNLLVSTPSELEKRPFLASHR